MTAPLAPRQAACHWCARPMPVGKRAHASYCKTSCRVMAARRRRRSAPAVESVNTGILARYRRVGRA